MDRKKLALVSMSAVFVGCVADEGPPRDPIVGPPRVAYSTNQETFLSSSGVSCPIFGCGTNGASAGDEFIFDRLNVFGAPNQAGVRIVRAQLQDRVTNVRLNVNGDLLQAIGLVYPYLVHEGDDLLNMIIELKHSSGARFELKLMEYKSQSLHFVAGAPENIPIYQFKARLAGEIYFKRDVCRDDPLRPDPAWRSNPYHALVFSGDEYDGSSKTVFDRNPNEGWFFLACAGSVAAKMHIYRHTVAGSYTNAGVRAYDATPDERTAMLKAITADYCGCGHSFTKDGVRLELMDQRQWMPPVDLHVGVEPAGVRSIEAIWTDSGAVCLDEPRLPWARGDIDLKCWETCGRTTIPTCTDSAWAWPWDSAGYAITANPY